MAQNSEPSELRVLIRTFAVGFFAWAHMDSNLSEGFIPSEDFKLGFEDGLGLAFGKRIKV